MEDLNLLNCELRVALAVRRELASENSKANLKLVEVSAGHFNEDIFGVIGDLRGLTVDDGRKRKNLALSIVENRVSWLALYNVKELLELLILLENLEELISIHFILLLECAENNVLGSTSFVSDGSNDLICIVSAH